MYRDTTDIDFLAAVQEILCGNPSATQREIARARGISLGMTNGWLGRLSERGWLAMVPLGAKRMRYAVTAEGTRLLSERRAERMRGTFAQMKRYGEAVGRYLRGAKERGCERVVLYGGSDLGFLIRYVCEQNGMAFETSEGLPDGAGRGPQRTTLGILGEHAEASATFPGGKENGARGGAYISVFELAG